MKTREFNMHIENFNLFYEDEVNKDLIEEYVVEDLEVPQEFIESLKINDDYVNIQITNKVRFFNEDWYVNLQRVE